MLIPAGAGAIVAGAAFTTDNPNDGDICLHGPSGTTLAVNCNIFDSKEDVWINGGPSAGQNSLTDGEYFFSVLVPGGQLDPNDAGAKNLSDESSDGGIDDSCGSAYTDRTFTVSDGKIDAFTGAGAGACTYATDSFYADPMGLLVNLFPYDTTSNPGGVYILAVCSLADDYPVDPRDCKYDAFKVREEGETPPASDPTIIKTVEESFDRTYDWDIDKAVDKTSVQTANATATFNYTVTVSHDGGTDSGWAVNGSITVFNGNTFPLTVDVTDAIDDPNANCTVTDGVDAVIPDESAEAFDYSCSYSAEPASDTTNTATVSWDTTGDLAAGSASWPVAIDFSSVSPNEIDECIDVTDNFDGGGAVALGTVCVGDPGHVVGNDTTWEFKYSRVVTVPRNACVTKNNTAAFETTDDPNDTTQSGSDNASVTACGPITNGFTLGFWSNKNGQAVLCANDPGWRNLVNALNLVNGAGVVFDVTLSGPCNNNGAYGAFKTWLLNATATNMSYMLSVQMAVTKLDVAYMGMLGSACIAHPVSGAPITISALIAEANAWLATHPNTTASGANRTLAEKYKIAFDRLNNNLTFAVPCS